MSVVGIDLGTSNSALASISEGQTEPQILAVPQVTAPGRIEQLPLLPSAIFLPSPTEISAADFVLPWDQEGCLIPGAFAKDRAPTAPDRVILSAKSWLCNPAIDRHAALLPWQTPEENKKLSPIDASCVLLKHLRAAYQQSSSQALEPSKVVLAVPASFDEVARSLTLEAAEKAGFKSVTLIEEPLAAFYAWISAHELDWRNHIEPGDIILVCDVGGGTADFSLIVASENAGNLRLERISVGDHILLGGDNMDLALAVALKAQLETQKKLDRWQFMSLVQAARKAKEDLFNNSQLAEVSVAIAGRGSSLFASAMTTMLKRELLEQILLDGFLPRCSISDSPQERKSGGLHEHGLPYANDPAVSRHLAHFLRRSLQSIQGDESLKKLVVDFPSQSALGYLKPTKVLFNGGVFKAVPIRERVLGILRDWCGSQLEELPGGDFDLAVARGAARFGQMLHAGSGLRIRAKTLRSYYLGVESTMPAIPGYSPPIQALCVVPQGLEEGSSVALPHKEFSLLTGQPAEFRFFSSAVRAEDTPGVLVEEAESELEESARLEATLPSLLDKKRELVPVRLEARVTELGALELWLLHTKSEQRWKLEFNVRGQ